MSSPKHGRTVPIGQLCHTCDQVHERCRGHKKETDPPEPCRKWAKLSAGIEVCGSHGGKAPQVVYGGQVRLAEQALRRLGVDGAVPIIDPLPELARLAGEVVAWKDAAIAMVVDLQAELEGDPVDADAAYDAPVGDDELNADDDIDEVYDRSGLIVRNMQGTRMVHPFVALAERAQERAAKILVEIERLNLEDRMTSKAEAEAMALFEFILGGLADAGVDTPEVRKAIADRMRAAEAALIEIGPGS